MSYAVIRMALQMTAAMLLLLRTYKCRRFGWLAAAVGAVLTFLICAASDGFLPQIPVPEYAGFYLLMPVLFLSFHLLYQVSPSESVFCFIAATLLQDGSFNLYLLFYNLAELPDGGWRADVLYFTVFILVYFGFERSFVRRFRREGRYLIRKNVLIVCAAIYIVNQINSLLIVVNASYSWSDLQGRIYTIVFSGIALLLQFGILQLNGVRVENQRIETILAEERRLHALSQENYDLINYKCHDLKQQLAVIRQMSAGAGQQEELKKIEDSIMFYNNFVKTGNDALDMLLAEKKLRCEREHIQLRCMADGESLSFLRDTDIYTLFGNAIDNAIESMRTLPDEEKRDIILNVVRRGELLSIHVENYCDEALRFGADGLPETTKGDTRFHGYGLKSMRYLAEQYGGTLSAVQKDQKFLLNILLPMPR